MESEPIEVSAEIVPIAPQGIVRAAGTVSELREAQDEYRALCDSLCDADDYQSIGTKKFRKKSGWRKLAVAFNVSTELRSEDYQSDEDGHITRAKIVMRATAPNGRYMDGIGLCDRSERCCDPATCRMKLNWPDSGQPTGHAHCTPECNGSHAFSKPDHDIPATAMTRATNRACADLFGLGEVSAEEASIGASGDAQDWSERQWSAPEQGMETRRSGVGGDELVSAKQASAAYAMAVSVVDKHQVLPFISRAVGREVTHTKTLTVPEFDKLRQRVDGMIK